MNIMFRINIYRIINGIQANTKQTNQNKWNMSIAVSVHGKPRQILTFSNK